MKQDINFQVQEFIKFNKALMTNAPKGYTPFYFVCAKQDKNPEGRVIYGMAGGNCSCGGSWKRISFGEGKHKTICTSCGRSRGSWKQPYARITAGQAIGFIKAGYNIGLAARKNDSLVLIDIDNFSKKDELPHKDNTLIDLSRKRCGLHGYYFCEGPIPNVPTEDDGEIRSQDQYVIIAGSYVPTTKEDIQKEMDAGHITQDEYKKIINDKRLGYYTVLQENPCAELSITDLPLFFKEEKKKQEAIDPFKHDKVKRKGERSVLFDLTVSQLVVNRGDRFPHPLHPSDTGTNFCIDENRMGHCWRHNVSLNAYQFLVVKSGYMSCVDAGTGHNGSNPSRVKGDAGALFNAWLQAKKDNLLPDEDPIPIKALKYVAFKEGLIQSVEDKLSIDNYNKALDVLEVKY